MKLKQLNQSILEATEQFFFKAQALLGCEVLASFLSFYVILDEAVRIFCCGLDKTNILKHQIGHCSAFS